MRFFLKAQTREHFVGGDHSYNFLNLTFRPLFFLFSKCVHQRVIECCSTRNHQHIKNHHIFTFPERALKRYSTNTRMSASEPASKRRRNDICILAGCYQPRQHPHKYCCRGHAHAYKQQHQQQQQQSNGGAANSFSGAATTTTTTR